MKKAFAILLMIDGDDIFLDTFMRHLFQIGLLDLRDLPKNCLRDLFNFDLLRIFQMIIDGVFELKAFFQLFFAKIMIDDLIGSLL